MKRTPKDCQTLAAMFCSEFSPAVQMLTMGMLCQAYRNHPEAKFWEVIQEVSFTRVQAYSKVVMLANKSKE